MSLLALKLLLSPALVGAASAAGRRFAPRVAGLAAALPIVAGPVLLFYALEQGTAFGAAAARRRGGADQGRREEQLQREETHVRGTRSPFDRLRVSGTSTGDRSW